jgi:galactokinase
MNADAIKTSFEAHFSVRPELIVRSPGRINLLGEHTDYNDGFVLPAAIDKAIWLAAGKRSDDRFAFFARDLDESCLVEPEQIVFQDRFPWANYLLGVISEAKKDGLTIGGLNLAFGGDVPLGAGLSSSAAIESGAMFLLNELYQLGLSRFDIIRLAQRGENRFVGMQCGIMDMFASVMGRENHFIRLDCRSLEHAYFPFETDNYSLVLLDSGVKHALVDSAYNQRRTDCETGVALLQQVNPDISSLRDVSLPFLLQHQNLLSTTVLKRCQYVVEEIARVEQACIALEKSDFQTLGRLMFETHHGLNLDYEVSIPEINFLVALAQQHPGVTGARIMGGGFGGCTLNLLHNKEIEAFCASATLAYQATFGLDLKIYPVRLSSGTGIVYQRLRALE